MVALVWERTDLQIDAGGVGGWGLSSSHLVSFLRRS
jgi:hypothetical protein